MIFKRLILFISLVSFMIGQIPVSAFASVPSMDEASLLIDVVEYGVEHLPDLLHSLEHRHPEAIIISAEDEESLAIAARESVGENQKEKRIFLLPFGKAIKGGGIKNGLNQALQKARGKMTELYKNDPIGVSVATITFGAETFSWVHVDHMSSLEKTGSIMFSAVVAFLVNIDKDSASEKTKPLQKTIRKFLGMAEKDNDDRSRGDMAVKFLASLSLATLVNLVRVPLINIDHLENMMKVMTWTRPLAVGLAATISATFWLEMIADIKKAQTPRAKFVAQRLMEAQTLIVGSLATSAMFYDYDKYGWNPWITAAVSGVAGLFLYKNTKRFTRWFEDNSLLRAAFEKFHKAEDRLGVIRLCSEILLEEEKAH